MVNFIGCLPHVYTVTNGVLQDNVLGPPLFLLYMYDVFRITNHGTPFLFVDDTEMAYSSETDSLYSTRASVVQDLTFIDNRCINWFLKFTAEDKSLIKGVPYSRGFLSTDGIPIFVTTAVTVLGLQYFYSPRFDRQPHRQPLSLQESKNEPKGMPFSKLEA